MGIDEKRRNLNVTWNDEETDKKINDTYTMAEALINDYAGVTVNYSTDIVAAQLVHDCARYIWNQVLDEFESRYSSHINALRHKYEVIGYDLSD